VPRRPSPACPRRFRGRPALCVASPGQGSVVHRRRCPHPCTGHGRGEHDVHHDVRHAHARPAVRAARARRDHEDRRWTRPSGRSVLPGLRGLAPGLAGVRRDGGRLCDKHHQPGARRCRSRTVRRPVCVCRHVHRAPRHARHRPRLFGGRRSSWRRSRGHHRQQHLEKPLRCKPRRAGPQGVGERRHSRDDHRCDARRLPLC